jgi:PAS domain S-box-containing protein
MASLDPHVLPVGFPAGIALGALLLLGNRVWPGVWLGALLASAFTPVPWWISLILATGNTLAALVGAVLIRRMMRGRPAFSRASAVFLFALGAALAALVSSTLGTLCASTEGGFSLETLGILWMTWWAGDLLGALVVTPVLLSVSGLGVFKQKPAMIAEGVGVILLLMAASFLLFGWEGHHYPLTFLPVPFVVWAALRFGGTGAALASLVLAGIGLFGTVRGYGPFAEAPLSGSILLLQSFVGSVSLTALLLGAEITQRKRMEAFFSEFVEGTDDLLTRLDVEGRFTYVNPATRRIFGLSPEECLGRSAFDFVHPDDRERTWTTFSESTQRSMRHLKLENRQVSVTGEVHYLQWTVNQHFDSAGEILAITSVGRDITELKRAEAAMSKALSEARNSEAKYRALFESAAIGINLTDTAGRTLESNRALQQVLGYSAEDLRGNTFTAYTHPDDRELDWGLFQELLEGKRDHYQIEKRYYRKDGRMVWARLTVSPIRDAAGRIQQVLGMVEDVTDRKLIEDALRASEGKLRAIIEHAPDVIFIKDLEGRYLLGNPALAQFVGKSTEEILGKTDTALFPGEQAQQFRDDDRRVLDSGRLHVYEEVVRDASGTGRSLYTLKYPYLSPDGRIMGLIGIARDLTVHKRALEEVARRTAERDQARELAHLKDHFLSMISHEMKTPLSLITGYAELLEDQCPAKDAISGIMDGSRRLTEHLNKVLDYSALLSGSLPLYWTEINLSEVLSNVREMMEEDREFQLKGLQLETEIDPGTPPIVGDSRRVTQMVLELLDNAKKFTSAGGRIGVRIRPAGDGVSIEVWDTGCGIRREDLTRIWGAFTQLETEQAMRKGGLGLGLTIVKKLAELHRGRVEVESREGEGSRFTVFLPIEPDHAAAPEVAP